MGHDQHLDSHAQAVPGPWAAYWRGLDVCVHGAEPILKGAARCNLELVSLASRRARAYFELTSRVSRCRSPQDLAGEQVRFWQVAAQDYADSARCFMDAWSSVFALGLRAGEAAAGTAERDYITFAESRADAAAPAARKPASRRAA
jgi:hypothetical protein